MYERFRRLLCRRRKAIRASGSLTALDSKSVHFFRRLYAHSCKYLIKLYVKSSSRDYGNR